MTQTDVRRSVILVCAAAVLLLASMLLLLGTAQAGGLWEIAPGDSLEVGCETVIAVDPIDDHRVVVYCAGDDVVRQPAGLIGGRGYERIH
jgi:hypothetical protein